MTSEKDNIETRIEAASQQQREAEIKSYDTASSVLGSFSSPYEEKQEANASSSAQNTSTHCGQKTNIQTVESEIDDLVETNAQLVIGNTSIQAKHVMSVVLQNKGPSVEANLMKDLVEVKNNLQEMMVEQRVTKENNIALEEAIQNIRAEKVSNGTLRSFR